MTRRGAVTRHFVDSKLARNLGVVSLAPHGNFNFPEFQLQMTAQPKSGNRMSRREIAESTLKHLDTRTYTYQNTPYNLRPSMDYMKEHTVYYPSDSEILSSWQTPLIDATKSDTKITLSEISTLQGARQLTSTKSSVQRVAVLNFASAKHEGGGFKTGAQAQVSPTASKV